MDWDRLRIFLAIARAGSLRGAAEALGVNHATIARGLGTLEGALGTRLFDRSRSGLTLTAPGAELLPAAEAMEREAIRILRRVRGHDARPSGSVRVSIPPILAYGFLARHLSAFSSAHPGIDLRVTVTNRFLDLARLETDVSIRLAFQVEDDVVGRRLIRYRKGIYAAPAYLAGLPALVPGDGEGATWIGWGEAEARPPWVDASPFPKARVQHALHEAVMQREAAAEGMGLTLLPCFVGDPDPRLVRVPGTEPEDDRSIWILRHSDLSGTERVRVFVDFMAQAILAERALIRGLAPSPA